MRVPTSYSALTSRGHGPSSYTIDAVASANKLPFKLSIKGLDLHRQFFHFYSNTSPSHWDVADFVTARRTSLPPLANFDAVRRHIMQELQGDSIVGSKQANHFINVHVAETGHIKAHDAQSGQWYCGSSLYARLGGSIDLFMQLR